MKVELKLKTNNLPIYGKEIDAPNQINNIELKHKRSYLSMARSKAVNSANLQFYILLKSLPEQPLTFSLENNILEINSNNGKYALSYMNGDEFPKSVILEDASEIVFDSKTLLNIINSTIFASGNDDLRPVMSGVFFEFNSNSINFIATDAHKLVKYSRNDFSVKENTEFIMPKKPLQLLKNVLQDSEDDVKIEYNETNAQFTFKNSILISRLIDGKYPNYEAVIPKENPNKLTISKSELLREGLCFTARKRIKPINAMAIIITII